MTAEAEAKIPLPPRRKRQFKISYGLSVVATLDGVTEDEQKEINKAALRLGVESITTVLKEMGKDISKLTAPFGWVSAGISVGLVIIEGISQYGDKIDYYSDDSLPEEIVRKEALMDAIAGGLHEGLSNYIMGVDDAIFDIAKFLSEGCNWLAHVFSGTLDSYQFTVSEMNYIEFIREIAKKGEYNSTSTADAITVSSSGVSLYAQDGDDYIENGYSNVTILAGHGDDMVSSYGGTKYNSILGGNGRDGLYIDNSSSTIEGGKDDDFIFVHQGKNKIYGDDGNDIILVRGEANTVSCGAGDDYIDLSKSTKTIIDYTQGDGQDVIYGYDTSDVIKIKGEFDNIMIYGLDGDDTIINYGKGVTINAGGGNDHVENYGASVKINGGDDNDYIYNKAIRVTINGGDGKDTIENTGNTARIDGGNDMDSIKNSGENTDINLGGGNDKIFNLASNVRATGYLTITTSITPKVMSRWKAATITIISSTAAMKSLSTRATVTTPFQLTARRAVIRQSRLATAMIPFKSANATKPKKNVIATSSTQAKATTTSTTATWNIQVFTRVVATIQ